MENKKLQMVHEQACVQTSEALAQLIGRQAIVDIVKPKIEKVKDLVLSFGLAETVTAIRLPVSGQVKGAALLLFSQETAFKLSDLLIKKEPGTTGQLTELDKSALKELGNIICGTYFATLSKHTGLKMIEHIAQFAFEKLPVLLEQTITNLAENQENILAIETEFDFSVPALKGRCFKTYFVVLFESTQFGAILASLEETERDFIEEDVAGRI